MGKIYNWFVSSGTMYMAIFFQLFTQEFIKHFPDVDRTAFHYRK